MDFDEIKKTWKNSFKEDELLNKEEIEAKLKIKSKSNTALNKVKRNYKIDLIVGAGLSIYFIIWMLKNLSNLNQLYLIILIAVFFSALLLFTWKNYNKIRKSVFTDEKLKSALNNTILDIEKYVNFNKSNFAKFILMPFAVGFGMIIGIFIGSDAQSLKELFSAKEVIFLVVILVIVSALFIPIAQFYNKKMYKQHLDELKQCLKEFEDIEE